LCSEQGESFLSNYGENRDSILVSIFEYIRSADPYDDSLAKANLGSDLTVALAPVGKGDLDLSLAAFFYDRPIS
jgi:hypothetical protein